LRQKLTMYPTNQTKYQLRARPGHMTKYIYTWSVNHRQPSGVARSQFARVEPEERGSWTDGVNTTVQQLAATRREARASTPEYVCAR